MNLEKTLVTSVMSVFSLFYSKRRNRGENVVYYIRTYVSIERRPIMIQKAYKFRLYPTIEQQITIAKTIGSCRFVFNLFLDKWETT
ncbi:MAG: helix-turn-helix domain-containing protein, partial [Vallitaleaceae bacterium]|nr:helix-turn-helix domain-containing protein [Vallitaleaceae bacterium]